MKPTPNPINQYHIFLASPSDVATERQYVRRFFDEYNRHTAHLWRARFEVVDWENYANIGVGRPQELITQQTLEKHKQSLALVIGIMGQRFGSPTGKAESGTEEEFNWAMESHKGTGFPEIKWFFRKVDTLQLPSDPDEADAALEQWKKVCTFRKQMQGLDNPVFYTEYPGSAAFAEVFAHDLNLWLADPARPWAAQRTAQLTITSGTAAAAMPADFDAEHYRTAVLKRYDKLNFEMLDTTGAFYSAVRLWSVFVPQSVRECHQYNPRLLEIPKEHQRRLLDAGEITAKELEEAEQQADRLRQAYFQQPLRPVLEVVDQALRASSAGIGRKLVILGDPGAGKSSLIRYLALRWAGIAQSAVRDTQPIPLVVELGAYARWECDGRKDLIRYLEEGRIWHEWQRGMLVWLLKQPVRVVLLLDGLDEVFDVQARELVVNDIQRFCSRFADVPVVLTSRVVGYQAQPLREAEFQHFMLQDLDSTQITDFLNRWHEVTFDDTTQAAQKRDRLQKAIHDSKPIAMLAGNPLLLMMMAVLNRNQELPRDRADLYAQASRLLLHQWDTERALSDFPGMSDEIGLREKTDILRRVASYMQSNSSGLKGNLVDGTTLTGLIEGYLQDELRFTQARAAARAVVDQLRQRNFILCFMGADSYAFVHRTFLEYFCAADFVHQFNVAKTLDPDGLIALFDQHCRDDEWREVLRLICGQIDEPFVGRLVQHLATRTNLKHWDGRTALPELRLAIDCLSEVRNITRLARAGSALMGALLQIYIPGKGPEDFHKLLHASQREIGTRWPGTESLLKTFHNHKYKVRADHWAASYLVKFLACVRPDRQVLMQLMTSDNSGLRIGSCQALATTWPDQTTRDLLTRVATQDHDWEVGRSALTILAEKWPDQFTRNLLVQLAFQDKDEDFREDALEILTEKWPDETTRDLLILQAIKDDSRAIRRVGWEKLAKKWPDQTTHDLLTRLAIQDHDPGVRSCGIRILAATWPDQSTRDLLAQHAIHDSDFYTRGDAFNALSKMHSKFGDEISLRPEIPYYEDYDIYLDPLEPITRYHIEKAAQKAGIRPEDIDAQVASLSAHLGWDITVGAKAKVETNTSAEKPNSSQGLDLTAK